MFKNWLGPIVILLVFVAALGVLRARFGGVAETPVAFASHTALGEAMTKADASGKPVLALVTADWCPPCQMLKREGLADPRVASWIEDNAVPAYIDATDGNDVDSVEQQRLLGVEAYPTLVLLKDGVELGRQVGAVPADDLLAWLERTAG